MPRGCLAVHAGRLAGAALLDREAVNVIFEATGPRQPRAAREWPAGLSDREVAVLRLVAKGKSNKEDANALSIAEATVHHHVLHHYGKIGVSTRDGAALFAMEHDLIRPEPEKKID